VPVLFLLLVSSCMQRTVVGEGEIITEKRDLSGFTGIVVNIPAEVVVSDGVDNGLSISTHQNLLDEIVTRIDGKTLVITSKANIESKEPVYIEADFENLMQVEVSGSAKVYSANTLTCDVIDIDLTGSGSVDLDLAAGKITGMISGSGDVILSGNAEKLLIQINGSGKLSAYDLRSKYVSALVNGSGDIMTDVDVKLDAKVNGSGNITYSGNPKVDANINGTGTVSRK